MKSRWKSRVKMQSLLYIGLWLCIANYTLAQSIPHRAYEYKPFLRAQVMRIWGLCEPIEVYAAQLHAESTWRPLAQSPYARGLGQQTEDTETWLNSIDSELRAIGGGAFNPRWSIRAAIFYDRLIWDRWASGFSPDDPERYAAMLHGYNAGPGWLTKEARVAPDPAVWFGSVETVCLRRADACKETRQYVRRILIDLRPIYRGF